MGFSRTLGCFNVFTFHDRVSLDVGLWVRRLRIVERKAVMGKEYTFQEYNQAQRARQSTREALKKAEQYTGDIELSNAKALVT